MLDRSTAMLGRSTAAPSERRDAVAEGRLQALERAKKKACSVCPLEHLKATDEQRNAYWPLVFDTALALYEYRRLDEALKALRLLMHAFGGASHAKQMYPVIGPLHAMIVGAIAVRQNKSTEGALKMASTARDKVWKERRGSWGEVYASSRPYAFEMEFHGGPPGPFQDDGIEVSRAKHGLYTGGYRGKRSSFAHDGTRCTVDRRNWRNLTVDEFHHEYYDAGRPVVLFGEGLVQFKEGTREDWTLEGLKAKYGKTKVFVSSDQLHSEYYSAGAGNGNGNGNGDSATASLADYLGADMGHSPNEEAGREEPRYCFLEETRGKSSFPHNTEAPRGEPSSSSSWIDELVATIELPVFFDDTTRFTDSSSRGKRILALGSTNTGSTFHTHGDAWFVLVHGQKRFILYSSVAENPYTSINQRRMPTEKDAASSNPTTRSMPTWLAEEKDKLASMPIDCSLQAGEIIYVPAGYRHGVINLADSIGVAFQGEWGPFQMDWPRRKGATKKKKRKRKTKAQERGAGDVFAKLKELLTAGQFQKLARLHQSGNLVVAAALDVYMLDGDLDEMRDTIAPVLSASSL
jgi:hypothetical protein